MKSVYTGGEKVAEFESYDELRVGENKPAFIYEGNELVYPNPVKDGLVLWYDFSGRTNADGQRGIAEDLSGNGNHGTLQNFNYTSESGYNKNKLLFDGVDDYIVENEPFYERYIGNGVVYLEATFSISTPHRQSLISAHHMNFDLAIENKNRVSFWFGDSNSSIRNTMVIYVDPDWDYTINVHTLGLTMDLPNNKVIIYINGAERYVHRLEEAERDYSYKPYPLTIGKRSGVMNQFVGGNIHSAKVYLNKALTPEEIAHNYAIEKERFGIE